MSINVSHDLAIVSGGSKGCKGQNKL